MILGRSNRDDLISMLTRILPKQEELELPFCMRYSFSAETYDNSPAPITEFATSLVISEAPGFGIFEDISRYRSGRNHHLIDIVLSDCFGADKDYFGDSAIISFSTQDAEKLKTLLHISMMSWWTTFLYSADGSTRIHINHDSYLDVHSKMDPQVIKMKFETLTSRTNLLL